LGAQTKGIFNDDRDLVPLKWAGVMGRHAMLMAIPSNADAYKTWMSQFDSARHGSLAEKVKAVSAAIEKNFLYETDEATYGKSEYWATPIETIAKGQGDCEDLAILKYYALKYLDVPDSKLYITVVNTADDIPGGHITLFIEETASTPHAQVTLPLKDAEICMKDTEASGPAAPDFSNLKVSESYIKIKTPDSSPFPVRKSYVLYYAFNETGVWAIPANSGPLWGTPKHEPAVCVKIPAGAARTAPSSGKMR
jgi:predicted transglutaminase-like cysteine proteinase